MAESEAKKSDKAETGSKSSATLLDALRDPSNVDAWQEFARRYGERIAGWCRSYPNRRLQPMDVEEISQEIMATVYDRLKNFQYDPEKGRFRNYLFVTARNACHTFLRKNKVTAYQEILDDVPAREDLDRALEDQARTELLRAVLEETQRDVEPGDWKGFYLMRFEKRSAAEVARELGITVAQVFRANQRVLKKARELARSLGESDSDWDALQ